MSTPNLDLRYAKPTDVTTAIAAQATTDAGKYAALGALDIYVASSAASADQKARAGAAYTCDGTADDVQIQAAVNAAQAAGGGRVCLSPGMFYIATPVELAGNDSNVTHKRIAVQGSGSGKTILRPLYNVATALHLSKRVQCDISDLAFNCYGSSSGITASANGVGSWSFWLSTFKNLYIEGSSDGGSTGWALNLESPFRSVFENIDVAGMVNGVRLYAATTGFISGNCVFRRCFLLTYGTNGFAWKLDAVSGGILNCCDFELCEGFADGGTSNTAISLGGVGQVNHTRWRTTNFEQYDTIFHVVNGAGNQIDGTYWDIRSGAAANAATLIQLDTNAKGTWVKSITGHYTATAHRLIVSTANDTAAPNLIEHVALTIDTGGGVTNSIGTAGAVITKWITTAGAASSSGSTVAVTPA